MTAVAAGGVGGSWSSVRRLSSTCSPRSHFHAPSLHGDHPRTNTSSFPLCVEQVRCLARVGQSSVRSARKNFGGSLGSSERGHRTPGLSTSPRVLRLGFRTV